jgi:hypothetical protein
MALPNQSVDPAIFTGGQMTDLPAFPETLFDGTELFELVGFSQESGGVNYAITAALLSAYLLGFNYQNTIITSGATVGSPYAVLATDTRVLFNKAVASASYAVLGPAADQPQPVLIRDLLGDASTNSITVSFDGSETCDGLSSVVISTDFGGYVFNPLSTGNWYLGTA